MKNLIPIIALSLLMGTSCNNAEKQANQRRIDSLEQSLAAQRVIDSMNQVQAYIADSIVAARAVLEAPAGGTGTGRSGTYRSSSTTTNNYNTYNQPAAQQPKKKGWSNTAKGAVIGAGAGALTGALVSDQKGKGAIIGGVIGAGAGAGTGAIIDKSQKNKEEERRRQEEAQR